MMKKRFEAIILGFYLIANSNVVFATDYLFSNTAPIAVHKKKSSRHTFPKRTKLNFSPSSVETMEQYKAEYDTLPFALIFHAQISENEEKIDKEALSYHAINSCKESEVELEEVFHHTEGSEGLDIVIFDARYRTERKNARSYNGITVPWDPLYDMSQGSDTVDARMQEIARVMNPDCLPARFRFIYLGSKRYQEIRYGKKAWEKTDK